MSRTEQDLVGTMAVDADAYYGIHSLRAAENFSITGRRLPGEMIVSMASIKKACARANTLAGVLPEKIGSAIESAQEPERNGGLADFRIGAEHPEGEGGRRRMVCRCRRMCVRHAVFLG